MDLIKEESNTISATYSFARCFNAQCPKAEGCLRYIAAVNDINKFPHITIVNPACLPADTTNCIHFLSAQKIRVAWGVKRLFDAVPYKDAVSIRKQLISHFGKSCFYRFHREERYLLPEEQAYIRRLFRQRELSEDLQFDRYTDEYNW